MDTEHIEKLLEYGLHNQKIINKILDLEDIGITLNIKDMIGYNYELINLALDILGVPPESEDPGDNEGYCRDGLIGIFTGDWECLTEEELQAKRNPKKYIELVKKYYTK